MLRVTLSRLNLAKLRDEANTEIPSDPAPEANNALVRKLEWFLCFASFTALLFGAYAQTIAASVFVAAGALLGLMVPVRALRAIFSDWLPCLYVVLVLVSVSWSAAPGQSGRYAIELAISFALALVIARAMPSYAFLSALMCALLVITTVSLMNPGYAWNAGALAMTGGLGSKNAFSAIQSILFLTSFWILLSSNQNILMRSLALLGVLVSPFLLIAGRSADSVAPLVLATSITLVAYSTTWLPPLSRVLTLCAGGSLILCIFGTAFIFSDTLFGQLLIITGKDVTLSGRTYLWTRASELISENPLLGAGYGAFWVQGNPYAEELWAHFGLTAGGFHFHNLWYEMGVDLGYPGIVIALLTVLIVSARAVRWVVRTPSAEGFFFLAFVMTIGLRSFLEVDIFSHFSLPSLIFIAAGYYARNADRIKSARPRIALSATLPLTNHYLKQG
jgi:exopolysaccharide production protein ExoQ